MWSYVLPGPQHLGCGPRSPKHEGLPPDMPCIGWYLSYRMCPTGSLLSLLYRLGSQYQFWQFVDAVDGDDPQERHPWSALWQGRCTQLRGGPVTTTLKIRSWPPPHKGIWKGSCATPMLIKFKAQLYLKEAGWSPSTLYLSSDQFTFGAGSQMIQLYLWIKDASVASYNSVGWSLNRWTSMQDGYGSGGQSGHWSDSEWSENKPSKKFKEYIYCLEFG